MIRLSAVPAPLSMAESAYAKLASELLGAEVVSCRLVKRAVDARRKNDVHFALTLEVEARGNEAEILARCRHPQTVLVEKTPAPSVIRRGKPFRRRPVVVGLGPAGLFAALTLAEMGAKPLVVERGRDVAARRADVERFQRTGALDAQSNIQFGEGGAGAFSDGKLTTGVKDAHVPALLRLLAEHGAPEEILWQAKPHIGTDRLPEVVRSLRKRIVSLGGEMRFETALTELVIEENALRGVVLGDETLDADALILAVGHSARDTFGMLFDAGVSMIQKPFSIGARIEHAQSMIDRAQYGRFANHPALGAAEYKLATHLPDGRGAYTFCMCPGGEVVAAASEPGGVVTNGMSRFARDGRNANAALLVDVRPSDFGSDHPLAGIAFQREWEARAFALGGGDFHAPAQRVGDFLAGKASVSAGDVRPTYRPGVVYSDLRACLPAFAYESMAEAIRRFDRQLQGFAAPGALLTGVETRSSCPLRIPRDETGQANIRGLYPAGEGAGYAGGILSSAIDGVKTAEKLLEGA